MGVAVFLGILFFLLAGGVSHSAFSPCGIKSPRADKLPKAIRCAAESSAARALRFCYCSF